TWQGPRNMALRLRQTAPMPDSQPFQVAVVDDDPAIRRLVRLLLKRGGYQSVEFSTGEEARAQLPALQWDLAILDRRLPDMDGVVLCQQLKADPALRNRYIIMLTGEDDQEDKIQGLDLGADDYITKPFQYPELMARIRAGKRIVDLQKELVESNRRLEQLSITDGLTKLHNHRHFQDELLRAFEESARYERPLSLAIVDLDFFKKVNDTYGHATGDEVLKTISKIFQQSIRTTDLAARYGGEEFALMLPETSLSDAMNFAEKIRELVEDMRIETQAGVISATVSVGVATVPHPKIHSPKELIVAADKALYRAKKNGRNQVQAERRSDPDRARAVKSGEGTAA
ncbi:MAG TPA: diguanylate cyclase, partial [Thermoanaerobaculia bacterium]|nr:diguanylate cyclase [Thermoanaerobaculia bacterium]